jgi:hypothetical protein
MGKFLAIHTLPSPATVEQVAPVGKAVKARSTADAYWVCSWTQLDESGKVTRILCEWDAKDAQSIRRIFDEIVKTIPFPVDGIYPMMKVDGETYR